MLPKAPSRNLLDAEPSTLGPLLRAVQTVARGVVRAFAADGVTVVQYNEAPAGQSVYHLHVHVIPRFDGVALRPHTGAMEDGKVLAEHAEKVRKAIVSMAPD